MALAISFLKRGLRGNWTILDTIKELTIKIKNLQIIYRKKFIIGSITLARLKILVLLFVNRFINRVYHLTAEGSVSFFELDI